MKEVAALFKAVDREVCLVGGAVRDMLRGKKSHDWDLATNALPEEVSDIFKKVQPKASVIPTGIKHGTVTVLYRGQSIEITTYRTESGYADGRRPDQVNYTASIEEDLSRRDFTMNAIALRLPSGKKTDCMRRVRSTLRQIPYQNNQPRPFTAGLVDPFGGAADIKAGIIRCVGNPAERFAEDGLRPLRAVRFAAQFSYVLEPGTLAAIHEALPVCAKVSAERVRDEIEKIIASDKPSRGFLLMEQTGLLELFLPELAACRGIDQKGFHQFDVLEHSLFACDYAAEKKYPQDVRIAALLHDIGKTPTRKIDNSGIWTFYQHEAESEKMARNILNWLRCPNVLIASVCHLVKEHMFHYTDEWSDAAVRRFIVRVGEANFAKICQLRRADAYATAAKEPPPDFLLPLTYRVEKIIAESRVFSLKDLAICGNDLVALGIKPGKTIGIILNELLETVLDDPAQNNRENLLKIAEKLQTR
ncbi:MAG: CCA tRNA nucleotidyltransferase [Treponema sp.]|nr:CCA tRNA nucleotidyltransferase [Treponema sp.]